MVDWLRTTKMDPGICNLIILSFGSKFWKNNYRAQRRVGKQYCKEDENKSIPLSDQLKCFPDFRYYLNVWRVLGFHVEMSTFTIYFSSIPLFLINYLCNHSIWSVRLGTNYIVSKTDVPTTCAHTHLQLHSSFYWPIPGVYDCTERNRNLQWTHHPLLSHNTSFAEASKTWFITSFIKNILTLSSRWSFCSA